MVDEKNHHRMTMLLQCILDLDTHPQNNEPGSFIKLAPSFKEDIIGVLAENDKEQKANEEKKERDVVALVSKLKGLIRDSTTNGLATSRMTNFWNSSVLERVRKHFQLQAEEPGNGAGTPGALRKAHDRHYMVSMDLTDGKLHIRRMSDAVGQSGCHLVIGYSKDTDACDRLAQIWG